MWRTVYQDLALRYNLEPNQPVSALRAQLERLKVRTIRVLLFVLSVLASSFHLQYCTSVKDVCSRLWQAR